MQLYEFIGSPENIGQTYGKKFKEQISKNVDVLVKRNCVPPDPLPLDNPDFIKWVNDQEQIIADNWPWLLEEMHGVAKGTEQKYCDILFLNLRVWQYKFYGKTSATACSSLAITLTDGSIANTGALDDTRGFYCNGVVKINPKHGHSYVSFPITGTSWGNRGLNSAGLCVGASSQILPGLHKLSGTINADIANRVILQTCTTVNDVRDLCKTYPFTLNLVCSDKNGGVFCAHNTSAGLFETANCAPYAISNHVVDDRIMAKLHKLGVKTFKESATTRLRRGRLIDFAAKYNGKVNAQNVREFIADRMDGDPASICPPHNVVITYANPQAEPGVIWIAEPQINNSEQWKRYECF